MNRWQRVTASMVVVSAAAALAPALPLLAAHRQVEVTPREEPATEMVVEDVVEVGGQRHAVVLKVKDGDIRIPILVGAVEAASIEARLRGEAAPRPRTHDLMLHAIRLLGGRLDRVLISEVTPDRIYYGRLSLVAEGHALSLDARPSDSIALALQERAPIFAARKVLAAAGVTKADVRHAQEEASHAVEPAPAFETPAL